jgi:hypothetical protein
MVAKTKNTIDTHRNNRPDLASTQEIAGTWLATLVDDLGFQQLPDSGHAR